MAALDIARAYLQAWGSHDIDLIMQDVAMDCRFVNGEMNVTRGADKLRAMFIAYLTGYRRFQFDILHLSLAADSKTVLNERLDFFYTHAGDEIRVPCAGAIVVEADKITEIRDYFDFAAVEAQRQKFAASSS